jgi:hypothetical protein
MDQQDNNDSGLETPPATPRPTEPPKLIRTNGYGSLDLLRILRAAQNAINLEDIFDSDTDSDVPPDAPSLLLSDKDEDEDG